MTAAVIHHAYITRDRESDKTLHRYKERINNNQTIITVICTQFLIISIFTYGKQFNIRKYEQEYIYFNRNTKINLSILKIELNK